jgi:putative FmdB family regulatory protein
VFEVRQRITEAPLATCDACGGRVKRLLSPAPFILKGEGWYVTDYPSESRKKAKEAETPKAEPSKTETKSESKSTDGSGATTAASPAAPAKAD